MRIVVFADSHGRESLVEKIISAQNGADYYIHLGDGYEDAEYLKMVYPELPILAVAGNCDRHSLDSDTKFLTADGKKIMYTHGNRFNVKYGMDRLLDTAKEQHADLVLFGHTHIPFYAVKDGIHFLNPGNANAYDGIKFATVDITNGNIICNLTKIF